ncbi:hypothetical protein [Clostridium sp. C105KSO13]|uniref:hypothetical protein n=1 Tax=Clostridium sp. C105KSO13 TaxID=1776045 RepID=UPI0007407E26|nr:hypothetical protein [Clostridium sp. C105KSO13]CUX35946.1 hypothetical protein BN3456_01691 [Clostridium sp. C105KSO13]
METERYAVTFYDLDLKRYTVGMIADLWDVSAGLIYEETNIFVSANIYTSYTVKHDNNEEAFYSMTFLVVSTRNPTEIESEVDYWNAYRQVIEAIRARLGNPCMSLTKQDVDFFYFQKL